MGRYIIAAGLAASEVGGLMMIFGVIGLVLGLLAAVLWDPVARAVRSDEAE